MEAQLRELGFSEYKIKVYLTLVHSGTLKAGDLSQKSKVPQGKIYEILDELISSGLVQQLNSSPKMFSAIEPKMAISSYISKKIESLKESEINLMGEIKRLKVNDEMRKTDEKISIFRGKDNSFSIAHKLYSTARKSLEIMLTFEKFTTTSQRLLLEAKNKGVRVRIIATKMENVALINESKKLGFEIRYYPVDELRIVVKDEDECIEMILNSTDLTDRTSLHIQSRELTKALLAYFDSVWKKAKAI